MSIIDGRPCSEWTFAELVTFFKKRSGLSYNKIEKRVYKKTGMTLPERTIISWANGLSKRPREWQYIVAFAHGLQLAKTELDCLLSVTEHPSVDELLVKVDEKDSHLLEPWRNAKQQEPPRKKRINMIPQGRELFGREYLIAHLINIVPTSPRLCFLTGMGGIGKTALAIAAAIQLHEQKCDDGTFVFADGTLWANAKESSLEEIVELWGSTLKIEWGGVEGAKGRLNRLRGAIARRKLLVVLDDVESPIFRNLLPSSISESAVLITTRNRDMAVSLGGGTGGMIHLTPLDGKGCLAMIEDVMGTLRDEERTAAAVICDLLGHLPLALTICTTLCQARRYKLVQMQKRLETLNKRLDMTRRPEGERGNVLAFEQSWEQLTTEQQKAYMTLAPFGGRPFTANLFSRVTNRPLIDAEDRLHELSALSLIDMADGTFHQHTLLADFASMKAADDLPVLKLRYAKQYLAQATDDPQTITTLWTHLMAGLQYAGEQNNVPLIQQIVALLEPHWLRMGQYSDARMAYGMLDRAHLSTHSHFMWGVACLEQSDWAEAKQHFLTTLKLSTQSQQYVEMAQAQIYLARIAMNQQNLDAANDYLQQAWHNANMTDNVQQLGDILHRLARIHFWKGKWDEATRICQQAIDAHQIDPSDPLGLWRTYLLRADIALRANKLLDAERDCGWAEQIAEREEYEAERALTCFLRAKIERKNKHFKEAQLAAYEALEKFEEMGDVQSEANTLNTLCLIDLNWHQSNPTHDLASARVRCERMLKLYKAIDAPRSVIIALMTRGGLERADNNLTAACHSWQAASSLLKKTPYEDLKERVIQLLDEVNCTS